MKAIFIDIAVEKTASLEQRAALQALRAIVADYEAADASFSERINASKARRGEAPIKHSPDRQTYLAALEQDRMALGEDMARQFRALPSAQSILRALHSGIRYQLPITRTQHKFFHPNDLVIGTAMLDNLETPATGMADFLQRFPDAETEERECLPP